MNLYLLLIVVVFAGGGKLTAELEVRSPQECASAYIEARAAIAQRGEIERAAGQCWAIA